MRITGNIGGRGHIEVCWTLVLLYAVFVLFGIVNIYSATYSVDSPQWFDLGNYAGKQILYAGVGVIIITVVMLLDVNSYEKWAWILYVLAMLKCSNLSAIKLELNARFKELALIILSLII